MESKGETKDLAWPGCWVLGAVSGGALVLCERCWEGSVDCGEGFFAWLACRRGGR